MINRSKRLPQMIADTQSGPIVYTDTADRRITLGTLSHFFMTAVEALDGAIDILKQMEDGGVDEARPHLILARLAAEHASDCLNEFYPQGDLIFLRFCAAQ